MSSHSIENLFENQNNWNFESPKIGHEKRFQRKLKKKQAKNKTKWIPISIAASLLLGFGIIYFSTFEQKKEEIVFSPQVQETQDYFSSIISNELTSLKKQETPQNKALIIDAMAQIYNLEKDYEKLKIEISKNGENQQIIYAMITNMQTRIAFLKSVMKQVKTIKKLKIENNENHI